jgi:SAM-dependent methyltransferase
LEQKGLIKFNRDKNGKIETVQATSLTPVVIKLMLQFFMGTSVIPDFVKFDKGLTEKIKKVSNKERVKNIMGIWFSKNVYLRLVNWFKTLADEVFILSKKEVYENFSDTDLKDVHITKVYNNQKIREPDNMIEMVAVPNYKKEADFYGMDRIEVLKEIHRILKPDGMIILVTKAEFPLTNDFTADELLKIYKDSISDTIFTEDLLKEDLRVAGFSKNKILKYKGCLIGIGWAQ